MTPPPAQLALTGLEAPRWWVYRRTSHGSGLVGPLTLADALQYQHDQMNRPDNDRPLALELINTSEERCEPNRLPIP